MICRRWIFAAALFGVLGSSCGEREEEEVGPALGLLEAAGDQEGTAEEDWTALLPAEGQGDWEVVDFAGHGEVSFSEGGLIMEQGAELTGVVWEGEPPTVPYEIALRFRRLLGTDFPCGLTLPVAGEGRSVTLIVGGWGGGVVGISSIDGRDASENETTIYRHFEREQWYEVHMVVREERLVVSLDGKEEISVEVAGRELGLRSGEISRCAPLGLATWQSAGEIRDLRWRKLPE